jgi:hypothetical protein
MTDEVRKGMVRRRAGDLPLKSIETSNLILLSRGGQTTKYSTTPSLLGSAPLILAHPATSYTTFLGISLLLFVCYLILPKGFRFQYCRSQRRRYAKNKGTPQDLQQWIDATTAAKNNPQSLSHVMQQRKFLVEEILQEDRDDRARKHSSLTRRQASPVPPSSMKRLSMTPSPYTNSTKRNVAFDSPTGYRSANTMYASRDYDSSSYSGTGQEDKYTNSGKVSLGSIVTKESAANTTYTPKSWGLSASRGESSSTEAPPSPKHPAIAGTPQEDIIQETMQRLKSRGIRLIAHGVQCDPKRVWIRLDDETSSVTWQTEFPRRVPTSTGEVSIVLMRGSLHKIALPNILYIDVGKKTTALKKRENKHVSDHLCFSLLTQNGSLDLQANSLLERDSLVSCFSIVLDSIHSQDWRKLYEESPPPSQVSSSGGNGYNIPSDLVEV